MSSLLIIAIALIIFFLWILSSPSSLPNLDSAIRSNKSNLSGRLLAGFFKYLRSEQAIFIIVPLLCFVFYSRILMIGHSAIETSEQMNYFRDLAWSFLHRRLDVDLHGDPYDLVVYGNKYYLYWPPVPGLVYMPLVALFGTHLPDAIINALFGAMNVYLFMRIIQAVANQFSIPFGRKEIVWLGIFWGLGTVHFYMSMSGTVWFLSQIIAQTFLLAAVLVFLRSETIKKYFLSGLWFGLAVYTRNNLVFSLLFFVLLYFAKSENKKFVVFFKNAIGFLIPFAVFSALNLWYNYARFNDITDNGINYHEMSSYFTENFKIWGYASLHYVPYNLYTEVLRLPEFMLKWPLIRYDAEGFGFIWASPLFLSLIPVLVLFVMNFFRKKYFTKPEMLVMSGSLLSATLTALVIFMIMGTGWAQFGARYTLDFHLFLLTFLCFSYKLLSQKLMLQGIAIVLICFSIMINYLGVLVFFWEY